MGKSLGAGLKQGVIGNNEPGQAAGPMDMFGSLHKNFQVLTQDQYDVLLRIKAAYQAKEEHFAERFQQPLVQLQEILGADLVGRIRQIITTGHSPANEQELAQIIDGQEDNVGGLAIAKKVGGVLGGGLVEKITAFFSTWWEQFKSPEPALNAFEQLVAQIAQPPQHVEVELSPRQVSAGILAQTQLLVKNSTNLSLATLVLQRCCGIQDLTSRQITSYIEEANQPGSNFKGVIFREIDHADNVNVLRKLWAKACYVMLEPLVRFYSSHFINNLVAYSQGKIASFQGDNFIPSLQSALQFMNGHLRTVEGAYQYAARPLDPLNPPHQSINEEIRSFLQRPEFNGNMTPDQLYNLVAEVIIDRFTPVAALREKAYNLFASLRIPQNSPAAWLNYPIAFFTGLISILASPVLYLGEWVMNKGVKFVLKQIAQRTQIVPTLIHSSNEAIGFGKEYKHAMNKVLVRQLERAWALMNPQQQPENPGEALDLAAFARSLPEATKEELRTLVSTLFLDVGYQVHAVNPAELRAHIAAKNESQMPESVKAILEAIGIPLDVMQEAQTTTVQYLAFLLNVILRQDMLHEMTLTGLQTANASCFSNDGARPTPEEMRSMEARRDKLLNNIITAAIRQAVNDKFYPMRRIQAEADAFVARVKGEATTFASRLIELGQDGNYPPMKTAFEQFVLSQDAALKAEQASPDVPNTTLKEFNDTISAGLADKLTPMGPLLTELSQLHGAQAIARSQRQALEELNLLFNNLEQVDCSSAEARAQTLTAIQNATVQLLPVLAHSHADLVQSAREQFQAVRNAFSLLNETLERSRAAKAVLDLMQGPGGPQATPAKQRQRTLNSMQIASLQAKAMVLAAVEDEAQLRELAVDPAAAAQTAKDALAQANGQFGQVIQPALEQQAAAIAQRVQTIQERHLQLMGRVAPLTEWANKLEKLKCKNPYPVDLTAFSDLVREFVVRQIAAYTNSLPLFFEKDFNWESMMHRALVSFVHEQPVAAN